MNRDEARQEIRARVNCKDYLKKSKSGNYCCPFCGSGKGKNHTGALKLYDTNTWTCHACGKSGDVIDLYMNATGADYNTALSLLAQEIGAEIDGGADKGKNRQTAPNLTIEGQDAEKGINVPLNEKNSNTGKLEGAEKEKDTADYRAYYEKCTERLTDPAAVSYLSSRGISIETAKAARIGYDPEADPASAPGAMGNEYKPHPCPRLIIPTTPGHYVGRRIDGQKEFDKVNAKDSTPGIFESRALYKQNNEVIFVCEGAFDALSVIEAGAAAIALNSASNAEMLINRLEDKRTAATLILCLDTDAAGEKAKGILQEGLKRLNIPFIIGNICASAKDPNEALTADREKFIAAVQETQGQIKTPDSITKYIDTMMRQDIQNFKTDIKTGFTALDEKAGGLYTGLYVVAAISSLGKTTFVHQMGDQIAAAGNDVLFFSLEMSRLEMATKSIARIIKQGGSEKKITSLDIRKGRFAQEVQKAIKQYKETVKNHFSVIEGNFNCNISFIGDYVRQYIRRNNTRPVIIIDYLQILQAETDEKGRTQTTKETIDTAITALKRLSRELNIIIFVVSSVNRANYQTPIDFESIKESGGVEYTSDCVWGLQLNCLNEPIFNTMDKTKVKEKRERIKEAKAENPREIELVCLKNRYGIANFTCEFNYYPASDYFEGVDPTDWKQANEDFEKLPDTITITRPDRPAKKR